jgi:transposase
LATLKEFPSLKDIASLSIAVIITSWRKHMLRAGGSTGTQRAAELLSQARRSVGDIALDEAKQDFRRLLKEYEHIVKILENIEKQVLVLLGEIPMAGQLRSIMGLGPIFIAAILAGAG